VHFVPNGTITTVVNMARGHAQAVVDVGIGYGADIDAAMALMQEVAAELRRDPAHAARIQGDLEMAGVERWADSSIVLRARFRVAPLEQWTVRREYLRRLKKAFDHAGIEIPFPQLTLHRPQHGARPAAGRAAPRVASANS
jgi:small conductance mechanosensitive channel